MKNICCLDRAWRLTNTSEWGCQRSTSRLYAPNWVRDQQAASSVACLWPWDVWHTRLSRASKPASIKTIAIALLRLDMPGLIRSATPAFGEPGRSRRAIFRVVLQKYRFDLWRNQRPAPYSASAPPARALEVAGRELLCASGGLYWGRRISARIRRIP
jgi:hypothetical protein